MGMARGGGHHPNFLRSKRLQFSPLPCHDFHCHAHFQAQAELQSSLNFS